ncbi:hypothetical protein IWZ03DRAFT_389895 [Phyllosticta citriasiana]|uniref:Secreted protein n=1 Tax=Phyllosticta citriasiana TaxID=595635 RepID=A0ABR1K839_9PEZI
MPVERHPGARMRTRATLKVCLLFTSVRWTTASQWIDAKAVERVPISANGAFAASVHASHFFASLCAKLFPFHLERCAYSTKDKGT